MPCIDQSGKQLDLSREKLVLPPLFLGGIVIATFLDLSEVLVLLVLIESQFGVLDQRYVQLRVDEVTSSALRQLSNLSHALG